MKITKLFLNQIFQETASEFKQKIYPIKNDIVLEFVEKEKFIADVKADYLIQMQIQLGIYKNIEKEYPNFLVVYNKDKHPLLERMEMSHKVSVCFEMAKDILKPYPKESVAAYLKQLFAHELTHIAEDHLIQAKSNIWNKCLLQARGNESIAKEFLAEMISETIGNKKTYQSIYDSIWSLIHRRIEKIQQVKRV